MATPFYGLIEEVRVMLVDNDKKIITEMVDLLESYNYKVNIVGTTSTAMSKLSKEKDKIDMIIISVHSSNLHCFELLTQAVALDIVSIYICDEHNELLGKNALDKGAYLYLKRPFAKEIIKYLWQFVLKKKTQKEKAREGPERDQMNVDSISNNLVPNEKYKMMRKRGRKSLNEINEGERQTSAINKAITQKAYTEWTDDLHAKFMKAVHQLGEGRCYPKEILEVMNVPGLTRMQVGSHLQKCRRNNWKAPGERKSIHHPSGHASSSGSPQKSSFRKFGTMPHFQTNMSSLRRNSDQIQRDSEFPFLTLGINNVFSRGENLISQPQVQPHYLSIVNSFSNPFLPAQNNVHVELQHGPLFGMLSSQDYSLDLNVAHGTTYLGNRPMPGTNIENTTNNGYYLNVNVDNVTTYSSNPTMSDTYVNELGASNANFQPHIGELNISDPSNIGLVSYESDIEGSDSNEKKNCDAYLNFNNVADSFLNLGPPNAKPN